MDATIRALGDPGRRALLDALRARDGQTVSELGDAVPDLGRHAVLKHLGVLEAAELVTTRKVGRQRFVHLNPVPIVQLAQRWLDDYGALAGLTLTHLRKHLEQEHVAMSTTTEHPDGRVLDRADAASLQDAVGRPGSRFRGLTARASRRRWLLLRALTRRGWLSRAPLTQRHLRRLVVSVAICDGSVVSGSPSATGRRLPRRLSLTWRVGGAGRPSAPRAARRPRRPRCDRRRWRGRVRPVG